MIKATVFDCFGVLTPEPVNDEWGAPNERLLDFISTILKPKFKVGMLSNADADWLGHIFTHDQLALFDAIALSFEIGEMKPHPKTYQTIAERLTVGLQECVFVDDRETLTQGATEAGMHSILYLDFEQCKKDLTALLNL